MTPVGHIARDNNCLFSLPRNVNEETRLSSTVLDRRALRIVSLFRGFTMYSKAGRAPLKLDQDMRPSCLQS